MDPSSSPQWRPEGWGFRLGFPDSRQEAEWQLEWAKAQGGLDIAFSLQTLPLIPSLVARLLWDYRSGEPLATLELVWLAAFLAWSPLLMLLEQQCPAIYLRHRTLLVLLSRIQRQLTVVRYADRFNREAMGPSTVGALPTTLAGTLGMLLWRPGSLLTLLCSYMVPLKYNAPCTVLLLATSLHSTLRQCNAECSGAEQAQAAQLYAGAVHGVRRWRGPWGRSDSGSSISGAADSGSSSGGGGGTDGTSSNVAAACAAAHGGGGAGPQAAAAAASLCIGAGSCRANCIALHSWLQLVLGALLPLVVGWAIEERSRCSFQARWLQRHMLVSDFNSSSSRQEQRLGGLGVDGFVGVGGSQVERPPAAVVAAPRAVPLPALAAWLFVCAWTLWEVIETFLLVT